MRKKKINFSDKLHRIGQAMMKEMWSIIEQRARTDNRYDAHPQFNERSFYSGRKFCEVDYNGCSYGVKGIRVIEYGACKDVDIIAHDNQVHSGLDIESKCVLLSALRRQRCRKTVY